MSSRTPGDAESILGMPESQTLEFKRAEALDKPERIGREAVAMLNAEGGEIWIGVRDSNNRAVGLEDVPDAESRSRRLLDSLLDTIEPTPEHGEVEIEPVAHESGSVLRVKISLPTPERRPFALLQRGGSRLFVTRVGDRVRPMDRGQILKPTNEEQARSEAFRALSEAKNAVLERNEPGYWLRIQPERDLELDLQAENVEALLREPERSNNLRNWHVLDPYHRPRLSQESLRSGSDPPTIIWRDGSLEVWRPYNHLSLEAEPHRDPELNGLKILSVAVSLFRLAGALYGEHPKAGEHVLADAILSGVGVRSLRANREIRDPVAPYHRLDDRDDIVFSKPFRFTREQILDEPDRCAARIVTRIYEAFGLREDALPHYYDRESGRLILD